MEKQNLNIKKVEYRQSITKDKNHNIKADQATFKESTEVKAIDVNKLIDCLEQEVVSPSDDNNAANDNQAKQYVINDISGQMAGVTTKVLQELDISQLIPPVVQNVSESAILNMKIEALGLDVSSIEGYLGKDVKSLSRDEIFEIFEKLRAQFRSFVGQKFYQAGLNVGVDFNWGFVDEVLNRIFSQWEYSNNQIGGENYKVDFKFTKVIDLLQTIKNRVNLAVIYGIKGDDHVYESGEILEGSFYGSYKTLMYNLLYTDDRYLNEDEKKLKDALWSIENSENDNSENYNMSGISMSEYEEKINEYSGLFKNYLKSKFGYSDSFIDSIFDFAKIQHSFGNLLLGSIKGYIKEFEENIFKLIQVPNLIGCHLDYVPADESETGESQFVDVYINFSELSHNLDAESFISFFIGSGSGSDIQTLYISSLIKQVEDNLHLTLAERDAFIRIVFKRIAEQLGIQRDEYGNILLSKSDFSKLNSKEGNFDFSWIDEIYEIIQTEAAKISPSVGFSVTTVDTDELFAENSSLDADYIFEHLDEMLLSNDGGVRKFAQIISDTIRMFKIMSIDTKNSVYSCSLETQKKDLIKWIITFMNDAANSANSVPPCLGIETINRLNNQDIFNKLNEITNNEAFIKAYAFNIDGIIEEVDQGGLGDCYLLSAIRSLVSSAAGKEMVKNAITLADDYSYATIYFAGVDKYITITFEEFIAAFDTNDDERVYSVSSDHDVVLIELAMEKLIGYNDLNNGGQAKDFWNRFIKSGEYHRDWPHGLDDLGNTVWGFITGEGGSVDISDSTVKSRLEQIWNKKQTGKNFAATFSFYSFNDTTYTWTTVNGEKCSYIEKGSGGVFNTGSGHEFSIVDITATTVTFTNPWDSANQVWTVSWEEFARMGISAIEVVYF